MSTAAVTTDETLTPTEATTLADLETTVQMGIKAFIEVGNALGAIRDGRLYRDTHSTFEDYCRDRWGISGRHAERQIEAGEVAALVRPIGRIPSESVARELAPLRDEPELMRTVWAETVERHGPRPTAEQTREVVTGRKPGKVRRETAERWEAKIAAEAEYGNEIAAKHLAVLEADPEWDGKRFLSDLRRKHRADGRLIRELGARWHS